MATMAHPRASLEPSSPNERRRQGMAPKSYADAAEAPPDPDSNEVIFAGDPAHSVGNGNIPDDELIGQGNRTVSPNGPIKRPYRPSSARRSSYRLNGTSGGYDGYEPQGNSTGREKEESHEAVKRKWKIKEEAKVERKEGENVTEETNGEDGKWREMASIESDEDYKASLEVSKREQKADSRKKSGSESRKQKDEKIGRKIERGRRTDSELVSGRKAGAGWERSGIRWAPLNVPLKRRLQTLAVLFHTLTIALLLTFFFVLCAIPLTWPLLFPYVLYLLFSTASTSGTLSHRSPLLRSLPIWSLFASYFPARLHRTAPLAPTRKYIFGYHPHGIISHGAFAAFATEALGFAQLFPGITNTLLTLDSNFRIPFYRDYALALGLASVARESCERLLTRGGPDGDGMGRAITIVVGGARESLDAAPGTLKLTLRRRKGFVRLAVRTGADLVPVVGFGENELYEQVAPDEHPRLRRAQMLMKRVMGWTVPLFHARGVFNYDVGIMPFRRPVDVVVGKPIKVVQQERPDEKYVEELHALYIEELMRVWEDGKERFGFEHVELELVE